jgi:3-hydroxybutyryl-CoA dehydratase
MNTYAWSELELGVSAEFSVTVTAEMMARFRTDTGDVNPLHFDPRYARDEGFCGPVVYGLLTASFLSTLVGVHLPGERCLLQGVNATFIRPVYVGDTLKVHGEVAYRNETCKQAEIACRITNQRGDRVSTARLKVGVREAQR